MVRDVPIPTQRLDCERSVVRLRLRMAIERGNGLDPLVDGRTLGRMRSATPVLSNAAFWTGLVAVTVMVVAVANDVPGFVAPLPTWESVAATATGGLALAGAVASAGAAVAVASARGWLAASGTRSARMLWRRVLQRIWPAWLALVVGYGVSFALVASGTEPLAGGDHVFTTVVGALAALSLPPLAGALVGCVVTAVIAGPLVLIGGYAIAALGLVEPALSWLGLLAGTWLPHAVHSLDEAIAPGVLLAPPLLVAGLVGMLFAAEARAPWARAAAVVGVCVVVVGGLAWPLATFRPPGATERAASALRCDAGDIELCVWPELEPERAIIAARVAGYGAALMEMHLPRPAAVTPVAGTPLELQLSPAPGESAAVTAVRFGEAYVRSIACVDPTGAFPIAAGAPETMDEVMAMQRASGVLAVALGGEPALAASASGWTPEGGTAPLEHLELDGPSAAIHTFTEWVDARRTTCGVADAG